MISESVTLLLLFPIARTVTEKSQACSDYAILYRIHYLLACLPLMFPSTCLYIDRG